MAETSLPGTQRILLQESAKFKVIDLMVKLCFVSLLSGGADEVSAQKPFSAVGERPYPAVPEMISSHSPGLRGTVYLFQVFVFG